MRAQKGRGPGGTRTPWECERTTTQWVRVAHQKGNQTKLAERANHQEWHTSRRGQGTSGRGNLLRALCGARERGEKRAGTGTDSAPPGLPPQPLTQQQAAAPAKPVVVQRITHPPRS